MNAWTDNFLWITGFMGFVGWLVPNLFWWPNSSIRPLACLALTFPALIIIGAALSTLIHSFDMGVGQVTDAVLVDPVGAAAYFLETGFETIVVWFPVIIVKCIVLSARSSSLKNTK